MGSQTAKLAIPYPVGTDRVTDGDNAMQALAERLDLLMTSRFQTGSVIVGLLTNKVGFTDVVFPFPFTKIPRVVVASNSPDIMGSFGVDPAPTINGFRAYAYRPEGAVTYNVTVTWFATDWY